MTILCRLTIAIMAAAVSVLAANFVLGDNERPPSDGVMPRIQIADDGRGFVLAGSKHPFHPWGLNYGNAGRLPEDFWESEWETIANDCRQMKKLGANVVRFHLQFGKFMEAADKPNEKAFQQLQRLLALAEQTGLYLDLTGLGCYRKTDIPAWYDALAEADRWAAQACFWEAVAARGAASPAVFCYDLMNEPVVPSGQRKPGEWLSGKPFGGYDFVQYIALDQAGRKREEIARQWIRKLTAAIRRHDQRTLVTVGLLPSTPQWGHFSGFVPEAVAPELDYVSVHIYPETGKVAEAMTVLKGFAVGKPVVIEETFPLSCPASDLEEFLRESRKYACGWLGHYDGLTPEQLQELARAEKITLSQGLWRDWLVLFRKLGPELRDQD